MPVYKKLATDMKKYVDENFRARIGLNEVADAFFVSTSTACHHFKVKYKMSVKKYINMKRMEEAKKMVENGEKLNQISLSLGFENYSTFFRAYKKYFGVSPSKEK